MKAIRTHNRAGEKRLLLVVEDADDRGFLKGIKTLEPICEASEDGLLVEVSFGPSYEEVEDTPIDDIWPDDGDW